MSASIAFTMEQTANFAESVDKLMSLDIGGRGTINILYPPVRQRTGEPLCMLAARRLAETLRHQDYVLITCGMLIYPYENIGETDGPVGAAALARAMMLGFGAKVIILTDNAQVAMTRASCVGAALNVTDLKTLARTQRTVSVIGFPIDEEEARREAKKMFDELAPKGIIAIERRGRNDKGVYHALPKGRSMNAVEAKMVTLFDEAKKRGALTIGIGDGGNEIGWGIVKDVIREKIKEGENCDCGCQGGIADATVVDVCVASAVSNWGAFGVEACLAFLLKNQQLLHTPKMESRMIRECIDAGGIDGVSYMPEPGVDGLSEETDLAYLSLLVELTRGKVKYPDYIFK